MCTEKASLKNTLLPKRTSNMVDRGRAAEQAVADYLTEQGCTVIKRNFTVSGGEIDLIVQDGKYLAFVEVKARSQHAKYAPREAVTPTKRKRLIRCAQIYLMRDPSKGLQPRFDVAEVLLASGNEFRVLKMQYIKNAFDLSTS